MGRRQRKLKRVSKTQRSSKGNLFRKIIIWTVFSLVSLIVIAVMAGYFALSSYLSGEGFKNLLERKIAEKGNFESVSLTPIAWNGASIGTDEFDAKGGSLLREIEIGKINAVIDRKAAFFDQHLKISDLNIERVSIQLVREMETEELPPPPSGITPPPPVAPPPAAAEPKKESWVSRNFSPRDYTLSEAAIRSFNLTYIKKKEVHDDIYSISNVRAKAISELNNNEYKLVLEGGTINVPFNLVSVGELKSALVRARSNRISVSDCRINPNYGGSIDGDGEWEKTNNRWWANIFVRDVQCTNLLSPDWKKKVEGILEGTARLRGEGEDGQLVEVNGSIRIKNGVLTALPVLDTLAAFSRTAKFKRIVFDVAEANFNYSNERWRISEIILASEGLLRVEGWVEIGDDESVRGKLMLGIVPGVLSQIPGAEEKVFTAANNSGKMGLLWANINLSGNLDHIREDLTARMIAAAGDRLFEVLPETGQKVLMFTTDLATRILGNGGEKPSDGKDANENDPIPGKDNIEKNVDRVLDALDKASNLIPGL